MSYIKLDRMLVVDFEATCWEDTLYTKQNTELIQVGIVPIDLKTLEHRPDFGYRSYIKPVRTSVSEFCTQLTGIKQSDVDNAKSVTEVFAEIQAKYSKNAVWASWGQWDYQIVKRVCRELGIENPFPKQHYNLKNLDSILNGRRKELGLMAALNEDNMSFQGSQHDAYDDALNTALKIIKTFRRNR